MKGSFLFDEIAILKSEGESVYMVLERVFDNSSPYKRDLECISNTVVNYFEKYSNESSFIYSLICEFRCIAALLPEED